MGSNLVSPASPQGLSSKSVPLSLLVCSQWWGAHHPWSSPFTGLWETTSPWAPVSHPHLSSQRSSAGGSAPSSTPSFLPIWNLGPQQSGCTLPPSCPLRTGRYPRTPAPVAASPYRLPRTSLLQPQKQSKHPTAPSSQVSWPVWQLRWGLEGKEASARWCVCIFHAPSLQLLHRHLCCRTGLNLHLQSRLYWSLTWSSRALGFREPVTLWFQPQVEQRQEVCSVFWKPLSPSPQRSSIIPVWSSNCPFCSSNLQCQPQSRKLTCPSPLGAAQMTPGVSRGWRASGRLRFTLRAAFPAKPLTWCEQWMKPASCPTTGPECTWGNRGQGAVGTQGPLTVGPGAGPTLFSRDVSAPSHRQRNGLRERAGAPSTCRLARGSWLLHLSSPWTQSDPKDCSSGSEPAESSTGGSLHESPRLRGVPSEALTVRRCLKPKAVS